MSQKLTLGVRCVPDTIETSLSVLMHFPLTSPELELSTKKKPKQLLKSLEAYVNRSPTADSLQQPSFSSVSGGSGSRPGEEIHFMGVCDLQVELEGEARLI